MAECLSVAFRACLTPCVVDGVMQLNSYSRCLESEAVVGVAACLLMELLCYCSLVFHNSPILHFLLFRH